MSSYLLAIVVSDFISTDVAYFVSDVDLKPVKKPFTTWGEARLINCEECGNYSQTYGPKMIEYMTDKLKIGYGFQKVDQVGVNGMPGQVGAMENWGLVTYE